MPAALVVGAAVFADGPPILSAERLVPVVVTYLAVSAIFSFIWRLISRTSAWRRWGVLISIPGLIAVALLGTDIGVGYQSLYTAVTFCSACLGAFIGALPARALRR